MVPASHPRVVDVQARRAPMGHDTRPGVDDAPSVRKAMGTVTRAAYLSNGERRCPTGDGLHATDDPNGGSCAGCVAYIKEMRAEWEADQLEGMRMPWDDPR